MLLMIMLLQWVSCKSDFISKLSIKVSLVLVTHVGLVIVGIKFASSVTSRNCCV